MIFFRAFPFTFAILWRYLLVLPILLIAMMVFGVIALIFALVFGLFAPFLAILFVVALSVASGVIPVMVGMRVGLQACEVRPRNSYLGLMKPAIFYGFFEGLCVAIIIAACAALFVFATPLSAADFMAMQGVEDTVLLSTLYAVSPALTLACAIFGGGLIAALRTALLIPFAGASVGADADGRSHTPFYGFGDGFGTMFALVMISYIGTALVIPAVVWLTVLFGIADSLSETAANMQWADSYTDYAAFGVEGAIVLGLCLLLFLWFFSLQCAGAVLVFMRRLNAVSSEKQERSEALADALDEGPTEQADMLELIRSRMPRHGN